MAIDSVKYGRFPDSHSCKYAMSIISLDLYFNYLQLGTDELWLRPIGSCVAIYEIPNRIKTIKTMLGTRYSKIMGFNSNLPCDLIRI